MITFDPLKGYISFKSSKFHYFSEDLIKHETYKFAVRMKNKNTKIELKLIQEITEIEE